MKYESMDMFRQKFIAAVCGSRFMMRTLYVALFSLLIFAASPNDAQAAWSATCTGGEICCEANPDGIRCFADCRNNPGGATWVNYCQDYCAVNEATDRKCPNFCTYPANFENVSCPGSLAYCRARTNPASDCTVAGKDPYCSITANMGKPECTAGNPIWCTYHAADVSCPGSLAYCQANTDPASNCTTAGMDAYCSITANIGTPECTAGNPIWCTYHAADVSCPGSLAYCQANVNPPADCTTQGTDGYCAIAGNGTKPECTAGDPAWCAHHAADASCPGSLAYCEANVVPATDCSTQGTEAYCAITENIGKQECTAGDPAWCAHHPTDASCPGSLGYCQAHVVPVDDCTTAGMDAYCGITANQTNPECSPGDPVWCTYHAADISCPGSLAYCQANNNPASDCTTAGTDAYCKITDNEGVAECQVGSEAWCTHHATDTRCIGTLAYCQATAIPPEDCATAGTDAYCGITANKKKPECKAGNETWCIYHAADVSCPGSDAYCGVHVGDVSCPGSEAWCAVEAHAEDVLCPGSLAFCNVDANKTHSSCPGSPGWCMEPENKESEICPGSAAYCALEGNENDVNCRGTMAYCEVHPYDQLCAPIGEPGYNNGQTPYSVYETSKSTGMGTVLCNGIYYLKSNMGLPLAALCVIGMGFMAMMGEISWRKAAMVGAGIAAIFGASVLSTNVGTAVSSEDDAVLNCLTGD